MTSRFWCIRLLVIFVAVALSACVEQGSFEGTEFRAPSGSQVHLTQGQAALEAGDVQTANRAYSSAMRRRPQDPDALVGMGETMLAKGDLARAQKLFDAADKYRGSPSARSLQGQGLIALRQGQAGAAVAALRRAVTSDATLWRSWIGLARGYMVDGDRPAAQDALNRAEAIAHANASALNDIGMVYLSDQTPDHALEFFTRAISIDPNHPAARGNIRIARAMMGEYDAAVSGAAAEDVADALNNAGYAAILNGAYDTAERLLRRALEVSPVYHAAARANLDLLNQATAGAVEVAGPRLASVRRPGRKADTVVAASARRPANDRNPAPARSNAALDKYTDLAALLNLPQVPTRIAVKGSAVINTPVGVKRPAVTPEVTEVAIRRREQSSIRADGYRWVD